MLESILAAIGANANRLKGPLTAFDTLVGTRWDHGLLVVGRAVNGWDAEWQPETMSDPARRAAVIDAVRKPSPGDIVCPMIWIAEWWGSGHPYNTARSAFFRVVRQVTQRLALAGGDSPNWPSYLAWTNLYRVSPARGGNPSTKLARVQEEACVEALADDIDRLSPSRILFLTGRDWAQPFLDHLGIWGGEAKSGTIQSGPLERGGIRIPVIVGPHPQGKPEAPIVEEIAKAWSADT